MRALKRMRAARVTESDLCHLHTRSSPCPLELDPRSFTFAEMSSQVQSTLLRLRAAIAGLATGAEVDHEFAREAPALGMSGAPLGTSLADPLAARQSTAKEQKPVAFLDNVLQFRFYSAWRGTLARRLAGLPDTVEPPI